MTISARPRRSKSQGKLNAFAPAITALRNRFTVGSLSHRGVRFLTAVGAIVIAVFLATLLTAATDYFVGDATIYTYYMIAIIAIGFRYGMSYLLLCGVLSGLTYAYFFADPPDSFAIDQPEVTYGLIVFTLLAVFTGGVMRRWRRTNLNLRLARDNLLRRTEELSRSLEREMEAGAALKNFIATMSHEFRTPLTTIDIIAQNETRAAQTRGDEKSIDSHNSIRAEISRISQLLTSLDKSIRTAEFDAPRLSTLQLDQIISEVCQVQLLTTPTHPIERTEPWPSLSMVGDSQLLRQLFSNLLINAAKYSPPMAPIAVEAKIDGRFVEITVIDTGIGIPADERERVFEQYYRGSNTGAVEGTGLGLTLCRQIVAAHGGDIRIDDNKPAGTRVIVRLPIAGTRGG